MTCSCGSTCACDSVQNCTCSKETCNCNACGVSNNSKSSYYSLLTLNKEVSDGLLRRPEVMWTCAGMQGQDWDDGRVCGKLAVIRVFMWMGFLQVNLCRGSRIRAFGDEASLAVVHIVLFNKLIALCLSLWDAAHGSWDICRCKVAGIKCLETGGLGERGWFIEAAGSDFDEIM